MPKKIDYIFLVKIFVIEILSCVITMFLFASVLYFLEDGFQFSPLFATISLGVGCFTATFYAAKKMGQKGLMIGAIIGGLTFVLTTFFALAFSKEIFTINTFFRLIILMLLSLIGGVLGVNSKQNNNYI